MAASNVSIANRALQKLGAKRISSLGQDNPNARSMNACFEAVRKGELRRYAWSFAIKRASIAADGDQSEWGGWNRYSLPDDFIRLLRDDETNTLLDWKIEGLYILSKQASPLQFRYVAHIEDPNFYDSLFMEVFAGRLALETCEEITQSTAKKESIKDDYKADIAEAKNIGAIEKEAQQFPEDEWLAARR